MVRECAIDSDTVSFDNQIIWLTYRGDLETDSLLLVCANVHVYFIKPSDDDTFYLTCVHDVFCE